MKHARRLFVAALGLALMGSGLAAAQPQPRERRHGPPPGPPPEAIQACAGLAAGAACGFSIEGNEVEGICRAGPEGAAMACLPDRPTPPPGHHRGPPPQALESCATLQSGAACTFEIDGHAIEGICRTGPRGEAMACAPNRPPPPPGHHRGPPPEALAACANLSEGAACGFELEGHALEGTCRPGPEGEAMACMPQRPPPPPK